MAINDRLQTIMDELPPNLQQEVLDFAQRLLDNEIVSVDPAKDPRFFICPVCFTASRVQLECHDHLMIPCNAKNLGDCKPLMDDAGEFNSRAPRWFIVSMKRLLQKEQ
jgi:hypothetical protein